MKAERLSPLHLWAGAVLSLALSGCALTGKGDALEPRYFSPEGLTSSGATHAAPRVPAAELRLGHVTAPLYLEDQLVYRGSDYQLGLYAERRWTEPPEGYLERRLARVLFEERGLRQLVGGPGLVLDAELTAFEEIRSAPARARVEVHVTLHDQRVTRWEETLSVETPLVLGPGEDHANELVAALAEGLRSVVERIATRVLVEVVALPPTAQPGPRAAAPDHSPR